MICRISLVVDFDGHHITREYKDPSLMNSWAFRFIIKQFTREERRNDLKKDTTEGISKIWDTNKNSATTYI